MGARLCGRVASADTGWCIKADDELELPVLDTMEWTPFFAEDRGNWGAVLVKQKKEAAPTGKKKKDK